MKAAVKHINATGGVAGRKLKVDFIDSKVNAATTRNAIITACDQNFAMVGTAAAFLTNVEDETGCKDLAGQATGLPDLASFVTGVQQCSPVAYPVNPSLLDCTTKDQHPQTYHGSSAHRPGSSSTSRGRRTVCTWRPTTARSVSVRRTSSTSSRRSSA